MSNVSLQFPDGSVREYEAATTGAQLAEQISKSLGHASTEITEKHYIHYLEKKFRAI